MMRTFSTAALCLMLASVSTDTRAESWTFVSSPDLFNSDVADLSGGADPAIAALYDASYAGNLVQASGWSPGGNNSVTAQMAATYNQLLTEMRTNAGGSPQAFLSAGDLINGRWPQSSGNLQSMFGGGNTFNAINNAADVYFSWYRELFRQNGFDTVIGAIGDHDIGDNSWNSGSSRAQHVDTMKQAFGRNMVDPLNLPAQWNGISSTAPQVSSNSQYDEGSFIRQVNNVLFLTVDVFRYESPTTNLHPNHGVVTGEVTGNTANPGTHLGWVEAVLNAADNDPTIDHVIVQGHTPILSGVRKQASSGMMMDGREDSALWQVLRDHSHQQGGKVRAYFGGEVHTVTATKDNASDIVQLVHGNPPLGSGGTNYIVYEVDGEVISANLYQVDLQGGGGNYWQPSKASTGGVGGASPGQLTGTLTIDASGAETAYETSGFLDFVDHQGLLLHYSFDEPDGAGSFSNTGTLGDLYYSGNANGNPQAAAGKFGNALDFDNNGDFVKTAGGLAPVTEGEQRTVSAWVNTTTTEFDTVFGYGQDNRPNGEFNIRVADGVLHLHIRSNTIAWADNPEINDGQWHHVAVVLPNKHENDLSDVVFYVDGVRYNSRVQVPSGTDRPIFTFPGSQSNIYIGADAENLGSNNHFDGLIDDVGFYSVALTEGKARALYTAGEDADLGYNVIEMEALFDLFDAGDGTAEVGGLLWFVGTGLTGNAGDVVDLPFGQHGIVMDAAGNGVVTRAGADLDRDGDVDDADFGLAFAAFTGPGAGPPANPSADLDGDGDVDDADFGMAFAAFTGPTQAANVPEPATAASALGLFAFIATRRHLPL